jgi:hypothetical protein
MITIVAFAAFDVLCIFLIYKIHKANQFLTLCMIAGVECAHIKQALQAMKRNTGKRPTLKNAMCEIDNINKTALFQTERYIMAYDTFGRHAVSMLRLSEEL